MARVYVSTVVNARNDRVWARVRDFNGLPNWHPAIAESRIEGGEPADKIGCVRDFRLRNGDRIREKLLGLSDYDMFCTYSILESPMGVENYIATLRLYPALQAAGRLGAARTIAGAVRPRTGLQLLPARYADPDVQLCRPCPPAAGHRRRPHLLALGIQVHHAARGCRKADADGCGTDLSSRLRFDSPASQGG